MLILKIGGGAAINLEGIARDLATINEPTIVVHGANALRDELARELNRPVTTVMSLSGHSSVLSDDNTIDLMMMAYAGLRNKRLVELLQQNKVNALGLSGIDGRLVTGTRNQGIRTMKDGKKMMVHDLSGKPKAVNTPLLRLLLDGGYTPVISVPILDEQKTAVNTENDEIVSLLQQTFQAERVIHLIEAHGLLVDPKDPDSLVAELDSKALGEWRERVSGRMKRKIHALSKLFTLGSPTVYIADGRVSDPITNALAGNGTVIR